MNKMYGLLLLALLAACKKEDSTPREEATGVLLNAVTGRPVPNEPVQLQVYTTRIADIGDPEFPNGRPVQDTETYTTRTDADGRYTISFKVLPKSWFRVRVPVGQYYPVRQQTPSFILWDDMTDTRAMLRTVYDTLYAERSGFVRYMVRQVSDKVGSLYVSTPYHHAFYTQNKGIPVIEPYNWMFDGRVDLVKLDTLPAEAVSELPVEWLHKSLTDTIKYQKDRMRVQPGQVTEHNIFY